MTGTEGNKVPEQVRDVVRWVAGQLNAEHERWIAGWPKTLTVEITGVGRMLFCHATPRNDTEMFTRITPEQYVLPAFEGVGVPLVVCGHTHMQFDRMIGESRVVNAGSVGMPFGKPGADWLLIGPDVRLQHTQYDFAKAAELIRATQYPQAEEFAARDVLNPRSENEALELFAKVELK
jgi:diadenosine tetraphosphatase ApaH/serine/threonine PP2A family protein phosphatase